MPIFDGCTGSRSSTRNGVSKLCPRSEVLGVMRIRRMYQALDLGHSDGQDSDMGYIVCELTIT